MEVIDIPLDQLHEAPWNSNKMDEKSLARLYESIARFSIVENLVVRPVGQDTYEGLSGNQRLKVLREAGFSSAPCVVMDLDDAHARLLAQALNHIHGEDDLGLRAELMRKVLETVPEQEVLAILPDTFGSIKSLTSLNERSIADSLQSWQEAQSAKLKHLQIQLTTSQLSIVEKAIAKVSSQVNQNKGGNPNSRGTAIYLICKLFLEEEINE